MSKSSRRSSHFNGRYSWLTNPIWERIRQQQQSFQSIAAFAGGRFNLARGAEARMAETLWVSGDFFQDGRRAGAGRPRAVVAEKKSLGRFAEALEVA